MQGLIKTNIWGLFMTSRKSSSTTKTTTTRSTASRAKTAKSASSVRSVPKVVSAAKAAPDAVDTAQAAIETAAEKTDATSDADEGPSILRKGEFVDLVVAQADMKKRDVRAIAEVMFRIMGQALTEGRTVAVDSDFKMRPVKQNPFEGGVVVTTKVRLENPAPKTAETADPASESPVPQEPLAEPAE